MACSRSIHHPASERHYWQNLVLKGVACTVVVLDLRVGLRTIFSIYQCIETQSFCVLSKKKISTQIGAFSCLYELILDSSWILINQVVV